MQNRRIERYQIYWEKNLPGTGTKSLRNKQTNKNHKRKYK